MPPAESLVPGAGLDGREPSIFRSNGPGRPRDQVLDDLERARLTGVGDRADDGLVGVDRDVGEAGAVA